MTSQEIINLLEKRHEDDVFYTEVSISYGQRRMDAWAMKKSWAKPLVVAYEVKVSRSDFLSDHKMQDYLAYCNEMYLVCPSGVCDPSELPDGFGLLVVASTGNRLMTKKKAPYRQVEIEEQFYRGLLMAKADCRYGVMSPIENEMKRRVGLVTEYADYAEGRKELKNIGRGVLRNIKEVMEENEKLSKENKFLQNIKEIYQDLRKRLGISDYGIYWYDSTIEHIKQKLHDLEFPEEQIVKNIDSAIADLQRAKEKITKSL